MSLLNDNWVYDEDNSIKSRKAEEILRKTKEARAGKKYKHIITCTQPLTIKEVEDVDGYEIYGVKK